MAEPLTPEERLADWMMNHLPEYHRWMTTGWRDTMRDEAIVLARAMLDAARAAAQVDEISHVPLVGLPDCTCGHPAGVEPYTDDASPEPTPGLREAAELALAALDSAPLSTLGHGTEARRALRAALAASPAPEPPRCEHGAIREPCIPHERRLGT